MIEKVYNIYKPLGVTPLQALDKLRLQCPELANAPLTYVGRLDPMAEGVLVVLAGEEAKNREMYLGLPKIYEANILLGITTDTFDVLGLPTMSAVPLISEDRLRSLVPGFIGVHEIAVPPYSSVPVQGKSLFQWAREGKLGEIEIPKKSMQIYDMSVGDIGSVQSGDLLSSIEQKIALVDGDFRQREILDAWRELLGASEILFQTIPITISCGSGTYIRSLSVEIGNKLGLPAMVENLKRTRVGEYGIKDSLALIPSEKML